MILSKKDTTITITTVNFINRVIVPVPPQHQQDNSNNRVLIVYIPLTNLYIPYNDLVASSSKGNQSINKKISDHIEYMIRYLRN